MLKHYNHFEFFILRQIPMALGQYDGNRRAELCIIDYARRKNAIIHKTGSCTRFRSKNNYNGWTIYHKYNSSFPDAIKERKLEKNDRKMFLIISNNGYDIKTKRKCWYDEFTARSAEYLWWNVTLLLATVSEQNIACKCWIRLMGKGSGE